MKSKVCFWALALSAIVSVHARAGFITGEVWQNQQPAASNAVLGYGDPTNALYLGTPDAKFNSGAFNYNPSDSGSVYTLGAFLNNPAFTNQSTNFSTQASYTPFNAGQDGGAPAIYGPNGTMNETYFYFTGSISLNAGANSFVVGHDDGVQLNIDGIGLVVNQPGPTALDETPFTVNAPSAGNYNFELSYGETSGPPASLVWDVNGAVIVSTAAPEPASLSLAALGLASCFGYHWRKRRAAARLSSS
jgi:hypothetical protein